MFTFLKKVIARNIYKSAYKPGHYYSPIPDLEEVREDADQIFSGSLNEKAIDLSIEGQKQLLTKVKPYINEVRFSEGKDHRRYFSGNGFFVESAF